MHGSLFEGRTKPLAKAVNELRAKAVPIAEGMKHGGYYVLAVDVVDGATRRIPWAELKEHMAFIVVSHNMEGETISAHGFIALTSPDLSQPTMRMSAAVLSRDQTAISPQWSAVDLVWEGNPKAPEAMYPGPEPELAATSSH